MGKYARMNGFNMEIYYREKWDEVKGKVYVGATLLAGITSLAIALRKKKDKTHEDSKLWK